MGTRFKPKSWQRPVQDLVKEYDAWDTEQNREPDDQGLITKDNTRLVQQGKLNPNTGSYGLSSKARTISKWVPTKSYTQRYNQIKWC